MLKSRKLGALLGLLVLLSTFAAPFLTQAIDAETNLVAPLPNGPTTVQGGDLGGYINALFIYGLGLAALIALAQLIFGAVQYTASAGAPSLQEDAKSRMRGAIIGLILLILSTAILATLTGGSSIGLSNLEPILSQDTKPRIEAALAAEKKALGALEKQLAERQEAAIIAEIDAEYKIKLDENSFYYQTKKTGLDGLKEIEAMDRKTLERTDISAETRAATEQSLKETLAAEEVVKEEIQEIQLQTLRITGERNLKINQERDLTQKIKDNIAETKRVIAEYEKKLSGYK